MLLDDVPGHGYVKHLLVIIPLESNLTVEIAVPIYGELIFFLMHPMRWSTSSSTTSMKVIGLARFTIIAL
jgi:hypothetical protein